MAESPGHTEASEVIPAGHPALAPERRPSGNGRSAAPGAAGLGLAALGIVFGDIGTSPIYTFRECFGAEYGHGPDPAYVLGVLSLITWALIVVVAVKYVSLIMRADNHGEGGILALLALAQDAARGERGQRILTLLGLAGAALFYGDSMITPAISVLSAIEGIGVATPALNSYVVPITVAVLVALFLVQKRGTTTVGHLFGPVMALWFLVIGFAGIAEIAAAPRVLAALNPAHAAGIFIAAPWTGFIVLGAVALAITGGEALYADMGHFGRFPIRLAWFAVVMPALLLN
jgi:KUP system potassium uptake protein